MEHYILKRQVRRNIERFEGDDFMFEVTDDELSRCQIGTLNTKKGQINKDLPFAFTELGVNRNNQEKCLSNPRVYFTIILRIWPLLMRVMLSPFRELIICLPSKVYHLTSSLSSCTFLIPEGGAL